MAAGLPESPDANPVRAGRSAAPDLPRAFARYGVAFVAWAIALALTLWLAPHLTRGIFLMFWPAVIAASWYGGWLETRVVPLADGAVVLTRDISERKRFSEEQQRAVQREHFLAEASRVLSSSLDYEATIRSVARLAVPTLADWCSVELLGPDGTLEQLAVTHVDPERVALAGELRRRYPTPPDAPSGAPNVVRTGKSEFIHGMDGELSVESQEGVGSTFTLMLPKAE